MVSVSCHYCKKDFLVKNWMRDQKKRGKYCSRSCSSKAVGVLNTEKAKNNYITLQCAHCKKDFKRRKYKTNTSKHGIYFCNKTCKGEAQRLGGCKEILPPHYGTGRVNYREKALREFDHKCGRCGYNKCLSVLEVHHIDRNRDNNDVSNLELLCRNCHGEEHYLGV